MKTLIVDDDFVSMTKMQAIMESFGKCEAVDNGPDAIVLFKEALIKERPFDLITLDISMPDMDGTEVLFSIREIEGEKEIPKQKQAKILMVTSHSDRDNYITCLQAGCNDYIIKPFDLESIKKKLKEIQSKEQFDFTEKKPAQLSPKMTKKFASKDSNSHLKSDDTTESNILTDNMKTLVVDDDFVSMTKMQAIMESFGECEAVDNGPDAIVLFKEALAKKKPFDLITLDISMPDMDGTEVLFSIREIEDKKEIPKQKQVKILMVTSHSDRDNYITCLQAGCNDYIVKPFDLESITNKLKEIQSKNQFDFTEKKPAHSSLSKPTVSSVIEDISSALKNGEINLPSFPEINLKLKKLIQKGANIEEVENLLKEDFVISSKLIGVSNSAYYKGITKNKTLLEAIKRLGMTTTQQIVETICNRSLYDKTNMEHAKFVENLWQHSMSCAYASQIISEFLNLKLEDDAFTLGLLHDIGKLILLQIIDELEKRGKFEQEFDREELLVTLDKYHGSFGASLLGRWNFSDRYSHIAKHHDNIKTIDPLTKELLVIHFANLLVKPTKSEEARVKLTDLAATKSAELLGLTPEMISEIDDRVKEAIRTGVSAFD